MDLEQVLTCLADADADRRTAWWCDGRYVVVGYRAPDDEDDEADDHEQDSDRIEVLGETSSLYEALDLLAVVIAAYVDDVEAAAAQVPDPQQVGQWPVKDQKLALLVGQIVTPTRRLLALYLLGCLSGPMDTVTSRFWRNTYLGRAGRLLPGARWVFLTSAAPPHHDEAFAILHHPPARALTATERALIEACRHGDRAAARTALAGGADVNAVDEHGIGALHVSTAYRHRDVVEMLLAAGADPNGEAEAGNAAHFAAVDRTGAVRPCAQRIDSATHWRIVTALLDAGADVNAVNPAGATLLDLAIATWPYPDEPMRVLLAHGARSQRLHGRQLHELLASLPHGCDAGRIRLNEVRLLLQSGAYDPSHGHHGHRRERPVRERSPLLVLFSGGYSEAWVPRDVLFDLVDLLLDHGVRDTASSIGLTAVDLARILAERHPHYRLLEEQLRADRMAKRALTAAPAYAPSAPQTSG